MLDKVRLQSAGGLPAEYAANLGEGRPALFDGRCCRFLGVPYAALSGRALEGGCDEEVLAWAHERGTPRTDEECVAWNRFLTKLGWRDDRTEALAQRCREYGVDPGLVQTFCELLDVDEGRPAGATRSWEDEPVRSIVVMGVPGCGKTTVARGLAAAAGWEFLEADDPHPPTEAERAARLDAVRAQIVSRLARGSRVVTACSAPRAAHRRVLAPDPGDTRFVHLRGGFELVRARLAACGRPVGEPLLRSQFESLEPPLGALAAVAALGPDVIVNRIRRVLGLP